MGVAIVLENKFFLFLHIIIMVYIIKMTLKCYKQGNNKMRESFLFEKNSSVKKIKLHAIQILILQKSE